MRSGFEFITFRMEEIIVISYLFNIVGQHREIHTEVRAFGFDWWFEKDGAKAQPASSKENDPEWGYTLQRKIRNDFFLDLVWASMVPILTHRQSG